MSIRGVNNSYSLNDSYAKLSAGKRINSAKDDAAGLGIAKKEEALSRGYDAGTNNLKSADNFLNVRDGALGSIGDSLQRLRELAVGAANTAVYGDDDVEAMQDEADQLLQGINDVVEQTTYNGKRVLENGSYNVNGGNSVTNFDTKYAGLEALGLKGFSLADNDAVSKIDSAINKINSDRSAGGASSNALHYQINQNAGQSFNAVSAQSRIEDLDYGKAMSDKKKNEVLNAYNIQMQKKREEQEANKVNRLLGL